MATRTGALRHQTLLCEHHVLGTKNVLWEAVQSSQLQRARRRDRPGHPRAAGLPSCAPPPPGAPCCQSVAERQGRRPLSAGSSAYEGRPGPRPALSRLCPQSPVQSLAETVLSSPSVNEQMGV